MITKIVSLVPCWSIQGPSKNIHRWRVQFAIMLLGGALIAPAYSEQEGDFTYSIEGSTATITKFTGAGQEVNVPKTVGGIAVYAIGSNAFAESKVTKVTIPESVTAIRQWAFWRCAKLKAVNIPKGVKTIERQAFQDCIALASISIPDSATTIDTMAFYGCSGLKSINFPSKVAKIERDAFDGCTSIEEFEVDGSNSTFSSVDGILFNKAKTKLIRRPAAKRDAEIRISSNITEIDTYAFRDCSNLAKISVDEKNPSFCSVDDVLFDKKLSEIIKYPPAKAGSEYMIPNGVYRIGYQSLSGCANLHKIVISNSVTEINAYAFKDCVKLSAVTLPAKVEMIEDEAFGGCKSLVSATFFGNAPNQFRQDGFKDVAPKFTIRFFKGQTGFTIPEWNGYKTVEIDPVTELFAWTSQDGRTLAAKFIKLEGESVILEKADGKQLTIPFAKLASIGIEQARRVSALVKSSKDAK